MPARDPGFGPINHSDWQLPLLFGVLVAAVGLGALARWSVAAGLTLSLLGVGMILAGIGERRAREAAERQIAALPPVPRADLTACAMGALGAEPGELAANAAGLVTVAQWARAQQQSALRDGEPPPPVQWIDGPASLSMMKGRANLYEAVIAGVAFRLDSDALLQAMKRNARYRVYFIEAPLRPRAFGETRRLILSLEALADG